MRGILRRLFRRSSIDDEVREELESHIAMRSEQNLESGIPEKEALLSARRQFGNPEFIREQIYLFNSFGFLDTFFADLRYALRGIRRNPGLSGTIVLTIAIGVGTSCPDQPQCSPGSRDLPFRLGIHHGNGSTVLCKE